MSAPVDAVPARRGILEDLRSLRGSPRELWIVLVAKLFESIALFSLLMIVTLWLSNDHGMSDVRAGWWAGAFSTATTLCVLLVGFFADAWGFRRTLIGAFALAAVARGVMAFAPSPTIAIVGLLALAAPTAAGVPVLTVAIRRYTTVHNRAFAFSVFYVLMNVGAFINGAIIDWTRGLFGDATGHHLVPRVLHLPLLGAHTFTANSLTLLIALGCNLVALALSLLTRDGIDAELAAAPELAATAVETERPSAFAVARAVTREKAFWRFMLFVGLLAMVKLIFQHFHFTWPKYVTREMGEHFPIGRIYAINPVLIIVLVPIATALTRHRSAFKCIVVGAFITASSVFAMCFGASYFTIITAIVLLSIGESLWSPRLYEYTATIAPRGREASYMGLSTLPLFFAKMAVGPMSGYLLMRYCPAHGPRHSSVMWAIIGCVTLVGPVLIVLLRNVIEGRGAREPRESPADNTLGELTVP